MSEKTKVQCRICKQDFFSISHLHLKTHNTNISTYKLRFPGAPIHSSAKIIQNMSRPLKSKSFIRKELNRIEEINRDKYTKKQPEKEIVKKVTPVYRSQIKEIIKKRQDSKLSKKNLVKFPDTKEILFLKLKELYPNLVNNYLIEKFSFLGMLEYSLITDMADPYRKIIFDFPKTIWHNQDRFLDFSKNTKLINDGWTINKCDDTNPTITNLKKIMDIIT